jgi:hypothetical protein
MDESTRSGAESKDPRGTRRFPFRDGAGRYRELGWTGTIPVARQGTKAPLVKGVTGHAGVDISDEDLPGLIAKYAQANLGLRLPWDIIGIDVDAYEGRDGHRTIMFLAQRLQCHLPLTWRSTSRMPEDGVSGIYLFHAPRSVRRVWVTDLGPGSGVEIAQYHHRFATVAPSVHNSTGRLYRWWSGDDPVLAPRPEELPELPVPWARYLMSERDYTVTERARSEEVAAWYARVGSGAMCKYMSHAAEQEATKIRVAGVLGGLHDELCQAVTHLCMNAAEGHKGLEAALNILEWDFSHAGRRRNLRSEWAGAVNTAMANAAAVPQEDIDVCSIGSADWRRTS